MLTHYDVIIIGGGAAGLMAAAQAGKRGRKVLLIEHGSKLGAKIKISGGGRCNFTNIHVTPNNYLSNNPHFIKSALARYNQQDFIKLVEQYDIGYHEKTLGQLFCDGSSQQIIDMLIAECANVTILLNCLVNNVTKSDIFTLKSNLGEFTCVSLIIATGGLSIPKLGATDFGYKIAQQFGCNIVPPKAALVPLIFEQLSGIIPQDLTGIAISAIVSHQKTQFRENILFTHRGLSGPAILQISSYLTLPDLISIDFLPEVEEIFTQDKNSKISNILKNYLPKRFVDQWFLANYQDKKVAESKAKELAKITQELHDFKFKIIDTEGHAKAEVTSGGVDTKELSSKTMESLKVPNLYFIGEVVDITGWLGGYNFQWAWSSGFIAGNYA